MERANLERKIQIGEKFESFAPVDFDNVALGVDFLKGERKKIILFSSTKCPFCKQQNPMWNDLVRQVDERGFEVLELFRESENREKVRQYLVSNGVIQDFPNRTPKIIFLDDESLEKNKLVTTPLTVVLNEEGVVEKVWFGLWNPKIVKDVNRTLGTSISHPAAHST